jgi:tetratricopeptide (TPR) repeat protein
MRIPAIILAAALLAYSAVIGPLTEFLTNKPFVEKLGGVPSPVLLRLVSADHAPSIGELLILRSMAYFGTCLELQRNQIYVSPDFFSMYKGVEAGLKLDPYNMDGYYFTQAFMVWDVGRVADANGVLEYGMRYRTWDPLLPFYAAFNYAYFLKDYEKAALYYRKAAELSGAELYVNLAGRYMQQSGRTALAISYLSTMMKSARNAAIRHYYAVRLQAFKEVFRIEKARDRFAALQGRLPHTVSELTSSGLLSPAPRDPYGGQFLIEPDGKVTTTSKFTFAESDKKNKQTR